MNGYEIVYEPEGESQQEVQQLPISSSFLRDFGRVAARGAEAVAGLPGDVLSAGFGLGNYATGGKIPTYEALQEKYPSIPTAPTSSQLRKTVTKGLTGESLEPQTPGEESFDTLVQDIVTLSLPVKGKIPFKGALGKALAGNAASWLAKESGGGDLAQAGAKFGVLTLAGLLGGRKALKKQMSENYKKAEELSKGAFGSAKSLSEETRSLSDVISKGHGTAAKEFVKGPKGPLKSIEKNIKGGKISIDDAWELKRNLNDLIFDPDTPKQARGLLGKVLKQINKVIAEYGSKNPEFAKNFSQAEDIYKGLHDRSVVNKFLQRHVSIEGSLKNPLTKVLLGGTGYHFGGFPGAAAAIGTGVAAREGVQAIEFLAKSPQARKYYSNLIKDSLAKNVSAAKRSAANLDKAAAHYQKNNRVGYEIIYEPD